MFLAYVDLTLISTVTKYLENIKLVQLSKSLNVSLLGYDTRNKFVLAEHAFDWKHLCTVLEHPHFTNPLWNYLHR